MTITWRNHYTTLLEDVERIGQAVDRGDMMAVSGIAADLRWTVERLEKLAWEAHEERCEAADVNPYTVEATP